MSRWIEQFQNHPFQATWRELITICENITLDDSTVATSTQEVSRLKKVVKFLDGLIKSCDPELVPESTWSNFHSQCAVCLQQLNAYQSTRNISYINQANAHLDNLLTYIRPYQVLATKAAQSARNAFNEYAKSVNQHLTSFRESATSLLDDMVELRNASEINSNEIQTINTKVKALENEYFDDSNGSSVTLRIDNLESKLTTTHAEISKYRASLFESTSDSKSISTQIQTALESAENDSEEIDNILQEIEQKTADFKAYYTRIFGKKNEFGEMDGGLKNEISAREKHLDDFKSQQEAKYKQLNKEIESLLPGATSAGLATAYYDLKSSFNESINSYSKLFYCSIVTLMVISLVSITQEFGWLYVKFVGSTNVNELIINAIHKLPIILPIVWLALFATKRRSELLRLQQEYAHKEALAKSYQSFKMQIEELDQNNTELMEKLLNTAIDAVSKNASDTLDKKHGDKTPVHECTDNLINSFERIKKLIIQP